MKTIHELIAITDRNDGISEAERTEARASLCVIEALLDSLAWRLDDERKHERWRMEDDEKEVFDDLRETCNRMLDIDDEPEPAGAITWEQQAELDELEAAS